MNDTLLHLLRAQELEYILSEQQELGDEIGSAGLESSLEALLGELPRDLATLYRRLRQRDLAVVVAERRGICSGCGLSVPTSQISAIRSAVEIQRCQNCGRILYHMEDVPEERPTPAVAGRGRSQVGPARFSSPDLMFPTLEASSRDEAIAELIHGMAELGLTGDEADLLELALERERAAPTAIGNGLAFPHVRGSQARGLTLALGLKEEGIPFGAGAEPARIVFLTVIPTAANTLYLRLLSDLIRIFRDEKAQARLLACEGREDLWRTFTSLTRVVER
jgi:mannitol/fructose-specific phosphotransferase system IIA component (Ntr-type)